jgi:hypothetical protein
MIFCIGYRDLQGIFGAVVSQFGNDALIHYCTWLTGIFDGSLWLRGVAHWIYGGSMEL